MSYTSPGQFDTPRWLGLFELGLKALICVLGFATAVTVWFAFDGWFGDAYPDAQMFAPGWVHDFAHPFVRAEWLTFIVGLQLHTRTITRAIAVGPVTPKVVGVSLFYPLLLVALVTLSVSAAFAFTYKSTSWWLMPQVAQFGVWIVWESLIDAFFKYVPKTPTGSEISRSF